MKPSEIRKILKVAKDFGVKELSLEGLTVQFFDKRTKQTKAEHLHPRKADPTDFAPSTPPTSPPELTSEMMPTEDELLLMSTPFYDQMQIMKRLNDSDADDSTLTQ